MDHISSALQNEKLRSLFKKVKQRSDRTCSITKAIARVLPAKYHNKYQLVSYENGIVTIATSTTWITWLKAFEHDIISQTKPQFDIKRIRWQAKPTVTKPICAKYKVYISPKSAKVITQAAKNIKQQKLQQALLRIASHTQD